MLFRSVVNAVEAMAAVASGQKELAIGTRVIPDGIVQVTVCDSGPGVDTESLQKIFEAFYTTKPEGMGMGLSISRTIVRNHGDIYGRQKMTVQVLLFSLPSRQASRTLWLNEHQSYSSWMMT